MGEIRLDEGGGMKVLRLAGVLTIESAARLREVMLEVLEAGQGLRLDMGSLEEIDLACTQVICAAHRSFLKSSLQLSLIGEVSEGLRKSLTGMALHPSVCEKSIVEHCLWTGGASHV